MAIHAKAKERCDQKLQWVAISFLSLLVCDLLPPTYSFIDNQRVSSPPLITITRIFSFYCAHILLLFGLSMFMPSLGIIVARSKGVLSATNLVEALWLVIIDNNVMMPLRHSHFILQILKNSCLTCNDCCLLCLFSKGFKL